MNFEGCTLAWKRDAERYLRAAYEVDWSPEAKAQAREAAEKQNGSQGSSGTSQGEPAKPAKPVPAPPMKKSKVVTSGFSAFSALVAAQATAVDANDDEEEIEEPQQTASEVSTYLQLPALPTTRNGRDTCPLEWWSIHEYQLPNLAKMARQFLALPASSAGTERLFSAAGNQHDDLKKSIKEDTLSMQLEVKCNCPD